MERELTLSAAEADLKIPARFGSKVVWNSPPGAVEDVVQKMRFGDPTIGWEGDPLLQLYLNEENEWEVRRAEGKRGSTLVAKSKPGVPFDERFILYLMEHDQKRRTHEEIVTALDAHNDKIEKDEADAAAEKLTEAKDRVMHAAIKDIGHLH
jgi:hypothetical protein|tara:strand:- start:1287 stop:1742 length:456 start_codon:yes stop_codon:yes gene_type:complete